MKRIFIVCLALLIVVFVGIKMNLHSGEMTSFVVVLSSFDVEGNAGSVQLLSVSSNTSGGIHRITLSKSGVGQAQTITFWDGFTNDVSTGAVNKFWEVEMTSGTTTLAIHQEDFGNRWLLRFKKGVAIRKSVVGTNVTASVQYK